jgi:hypothetical protein
MMSYSHNSKYYDLRGFGCDEITYHLFQGQTLGLGDEEEDERSTEVG